MAKRKEADCCEFSPKTSRASDQNPSFKKQKTMVMNLNNSISLKGNPKLCPAFKFVSFNVHLNGEPFHDFLAKGVNDDTRDKNVVETASSDLNNNTGSHVCDLSLTLSLPYYHSNHSPVITQSSNCQQEDHNSDQRSVDLEDPVDAVPLRMFHPVNPPQQIEWTMMKKLTDSDCNGQSRLMISKKLVQHHIIPHLHDPARVQISSFNGLRVDVFDCDMGIQLQLSLKKWPSTNCYALVDNWRRDFVNRRGLKLGDEVGLSWEKNQNRLLFSVLQRSSVVGS